MLARIPLVCRFMLFTCGICLLIGAQAQSSPQSTPPTPAAPMTVEDAVAFALQHNPAITLATQDVSVAQSQWLAARAGVRPSLGLGVSATYVPGARPCR